MTAGPMAPSDPSRAPALLAGAALVALVPATDDLARAAAAAWGFARHVAGSGRRVALIDCYVDSPWLHGAAGEPNGDGIVDVFEYGASLSRIARPQPEPTLFFVPAGTLSADPVVTMANPRWKRLAAGFRHEDALMLLFLPPEALDAIGAELDGLVALAPDGVEAALAATPEIQAALDAGRRLVATVTDEGGIAWADGAPRPAAARVRVEPPVVEPLPFELVDEPVTTPVAEPPAPPAPATPAPTAAAADHVAAALPDGAPPPFTADAAQPEPAVAAESMEPASGETGAPAAEVPPPEAVEPAARGATGALDIPPASWVAEPPPRRRSSRTFRQLPAPPPRGRWVVLGFVALGLAGLGIAAYQRMTRRAERQGPRPQAEASRAGPAAPAAAPSPAPGPRPAESPAPKPAPAQERGAPARPVPGPSLPVATPSPVARRVDSLSYAVQVSAFARLREALTEGDRLAAARVPSMVAPIRIGQRVWYRVYAGPVPSRGAADTLLRALQGARQDAAQAVVARVPLSFTLGSFPSESAAQAAGRRLRQRGVPTFVLGRADGWFALLAGAYATAAQAADLDRLLTSTGSAGSLGPRVGTPP